MDDGWISHPIFPLQRSCDQLALQIAVATYPAAIACPTIPETFFPHGVVVVASSAMPIRSSEEQIRHLKDMSVGSMDGHAGYTPLREPYLKSSDHINIPINDLKLPKTFQQVPAVKSIHWSVISLLLAILWQWECFWIEEFIGNPHLFD